MQQKTFLFNVPLKRYLASRARDPGSSPGRGTSFPLDYKGSRSSTNTRGLQQRKNFHSTPAD